MVILPTERVMGELRVEFTESRFGLGMEDETAEGHPGRKDWSCLSNLRGSNLGMVVTIPMEGKMARGNILGTVT